MKVTNKSEKYFQRSIKAIELGQYRKAKKWLNIASFYGHPIEQIYFQRGIISLRLLKLTDALNFFHLYLSREHDADNIIYYYLAETYNMMGNSNESIKYYKMSFEGTTELLIKCKSLLNLEKAFNNSSEANLQIMRSKLDYFLIANYDKINELRVDACISIIKGNYDIAIDILKNLANKNPNFVDIYKELCECYLRANLYDELIQIIKNNKNIFKRDKSFKIYLAKAYYHTNRLSEAKKELSTILKIVPGNSKLFFNMANVYYKLNQINSAIKYYTKAIKKDSKFYESYFNLGVLHHKSGLLNFSQEYYTKAKDLNFKLVPANYNLGILYYQKKNYFDSLNAFQQALQDNNDDHRAIHNFNAIKNLKFIDPDINIDKKILSMLNIYLFVIAGILLLLFILFS
ncbi:MAG: tetratricopeptide repeat protein [Spirochaetota bacterium]|nr:tetratricopeptide repeat protein [Spirochaetota bacterium]